MANLSKIRIKKPKSNKTNFNFTIEDDSKSFTNSLESEKGIAPIVKRPKFNFTKKHRIITGLVMAIIAIALAVFFTTKPVDTTLTAKTKLKVNVPAPIYYSPLSGMVVTKAQSILPVTAVMIENSDGARPQSGLSEAGVIFEALAEGGVTRFMAVYQEGEPSSLGPIRSARPYYIDWALGFDAAYVHVGGSPDALTQIQTDKVRDINQFYYGNSFTRITSRIAPHNVYTSLSTLLSLESSLGYNNSAFTGFPRKADQPAKIPTTTEINMNLSSADFAVSYVYQKTTNSYLRSEAGAPMIDSNTSLQLAPKVVIAMVVPWSQGTLDASNAYYSDYADIGSGNCYIFQDGIMTKATWTKTSPTSQITFTNALGGPIKLNRGQTWITAVSTDSDVTYL
jgi:hypothetical protein